MLKLEYEDNFHLEEAISKSKKIIVCGRNNTGTPSSVGCLIK